PEQPSINKIKKKDNELVVNLKPTADILKSVGKTKSNQQILVGFALETNNELENAKNKLRTKNLDLIVLNSLNEKGAGFGFDTNKVTFIDATGNVTSFDLKTKTAVARDILNKIESLRKNKND
ncbi:MAG TPA: phosphopantothenoylcysteine decarboxylase, partial [Bacteroidales bacterium]|nr:phosphopantothenoylcysteine decarboxylase [Bacteroidales bacterium]